MTSIAFESMVSQLTAMGVPREKAEARARAELPAEARRIDAEAVRADHVREKDEQRAIRRMALAVGFRVYWASQARRTGQTPGIPDLWLTHRERKVAGWWEAKRQVGGALSPSQQEFREECEVSSIPYGFGDRYAFADWLQRRGFTVPAIPDSA